MRRIIYSCKDAKDIAPLDHWRKLGEVVGQGGLPYDRGNTPLRSAHGSAPSPGRSVPAEWVEMPENKPAAFLRYHALAQLVGKEAPIEVVLTSAVSHINWHRLEIPNILYYDI